MGGLFGGGGSTVQNVPGPMSDEERQLIALQTQLGQKQLTAYDQIQPYQQQLLDYSTQQLQQNQAYNTALNSAISPEDQAAAAKEQFDQARALGPIQQQLLQAQLDQLKQGGRATDQQKADIGSATDAAIAAGSGDIDTNTKRGISMISDELANSRGLRLSDSPISSEAALLARAGTDQKASLTNNLRAAQATSVLNYPLAVQQMTSAQNQGQQQILSSAQQFQDQIRNQAYQNRLSLTGAASGGGIGLAGIGPGSGAISALQANRGNTSNTQATMGFGDTLKGIGSLASGIGALAAYSDRRLKIDAGVVAETKGGHKLHLFRYHGESEHTPLRLGVMADEAKRIRPDAVHRHSSGYDVVDYSKVA